MKRIGLTRNQNTFDDVGLTLYRCPGVYHIAILIFDHKFGSAQFFVSRDICLGDIYPGDIILHLHCGRCPIHIHCKDNVICNHIAVRRDLLMQGVGLACNQFTVDLMGLAFL